MYSNKNYKQLIKLVDYFVLKEGYETYDLIIFYTSDNDEYIRAIYAVWDDTNNEYNFFNRPRHLWEDVDITIVGIMVPGEHKPDYIWEGEKWIMREENEGNQLSTLES